MPYTTGDEMRFTGFSGVLSEIVTDVPTSNKTIDFVFPTFNCGDSVTFIYNGSSVTYGTVMSSANCWLDRNLGASQVATSSTDTAAYGHYFQWGRGPDGHQLLTSWIASNLSSTDQPSTSSFIIAPNSPFDWRSPRNNSLWQGVNGINNPCPPGWRIPTATELDDERQSWSSNDGAGAFASPLKLTMAGSRSSSLGTLDLSLSRYWSSSVWSNISQSVALRLLPHTADMNQMERASGFSVRCIKD